MNAEDKLKFIPRVVQLLRREIECNGNVYDGGMVPNLTSISVLCAMPDVLIEGCVEAVAAMERARRAKGEGV